MPDDTKTPRTLRLTADPQAPRTRGTDAEGRRWSVYAPPPGTCQDVCVYCGEPMPDGGWWHMAPAFSHEADLTVHADHVVLGPARSVH